MMSETFKIHLQGTAETQAWMQAEGVLRKLDDSANDFLNSLKQGVGIDLGGRIVDSLAQLPGLFSGILERGYDFNAQMTGAESGVANVLAKFLKLDEQAAKQEAAKAMAAIVEWEPKAAGSLQDLTQGFMATVGAGTAAGMTVAQNVELTGKFANALAALSMDASQLQQEMRAIFTGNITPDAALANTLQITSADVRRAKEAGQLFEYLNQQIGALGNTAAGPAVVMSSLSSAIDKDAGVLSRSFFEEVTQGASDLTEALSDPAIQTSLREMGVSIGAVAKQGAALTMWAVQNAPLLLQVAEGAVRVGAALAGIKLATIIAGLVLKAQRWVAVTAAVNANTAALSANSAAAATNMAAAPAVAAASTTAGAAGGAAAGRAWVGGFSSFMRGVGALAVVGLVMKIMDQAGEIMNLSAEGNTVNDAAAKRLLDPKMGGAQAPTELLRSEITNAGTPQDVAAARRLGEIMLRDAKRNEDTVLVNGVTALMGAFDRLVGTEVDHKKAADDARGAQLALNAALLAGQAAAGDSEARIKQAAAAVEQLAGKLAAAAGVKLDTTTFESLLSGLEGLNAVAVADNSKDITKLIELAGELRDLKADAAKEAATQADKAKRDADELRQKRVEELELQSRILQATGRAAAARNAQAEAEILKLQGEGLNPEQARGVVRGEAAAKNAEERKRTEMAREVAEIEDQISRARAKGDKEGEQALRDRLAVMQLASQMQGDLGLSAGDAEMRARARIADERAAAEREELQQKFKAGEYKRPAQRGGRALTSYGLESDASGLRGDGSSSLDAFAQRQGRSLRGDFSFPRLDAFDRSNAQTPTAAAAGSAQPAGNDRGADIANAARQAAEAAREASKGTGENGKATVEALHALRDELRQVTAELAEVKSQLSHSNRS